MILIKTMKPHRVKQSEESDLQTILKQGAIHTSSERNYLGAKRLFSFLSAIMRRIKIGLTPSPRGKQTQGDGVVIITFLHHDVSAVTLVGPPLVTILVVDQGAIFRQSRLSGTICFVLLSVTHGFFPPRFSATCCPTYLYHLN